jgi:hypothetical protein
MRRRFVLGARRCRVSRRRTNDDGTGRVTASPGGKRDVSCHGRRGLAVGTLQAAAIADVGLGDPVGNDPRVRRAPPEYNLPVISRLPGIWYGER